MPDLAEPESTTDTETDKVTPVRFARVDALFAGEPPPKPIEAAPVIAKLKLVLAIAIPLSLLGVPCWTGVPGAAMVLWAYLTVDGEMARIEGGQYSGDDAALLIRLRTISTWALYFCVFSFLVQAWLLSTPIYTQFYLGLWEWLLGSETVLIGP